MDFVAVICLREVGGCGGTVEDYLADQEHRGLHRPICPRCHQRVWVQADAGKVMRVVRVDKKPRKVPRPV